MKAGGAELVLRALEAEGVRFTFGIPGTHNIELYDALSSSQQIRPVLVTDEQSASFMADGVSRSSDSLGVVNVVPGAGVTHCLSGVAEAFMDGIPMLVLTCGIRTDTGKSYQLHDIDQLALLKPVTKGVFKADDPAAIYGTIRRACALARSGTPGPVAVEIPANFYLLRQDVGDPIVEIAPPTVASPDLRLIDQAAGMLGSSSRPIIYAGYGARRAGTALQTLAERLDAPVATTIQGKGVFPESHPLFLWNGLGSSAPPFIRKIEKDSDCMLAIGCRFGEVATASYGFTAPRSLIHVDINPDVFSRNYPADVAIESDAGAAIAALLDRIPGRPAALAPVIARGHEDVKSQWRGQHSAGRVTPALLFSALQQRAGADCIYATDSGNGTFLAMEHLRLEAPGRFLAPVDFSCMGYSVPAAIGAKLANPSRDVVALAGDGALLMTGLELSTAAACGAGIVALVLRDGELAQIAQFQRTALNRATCSTLNPYNLDSLAAAVNSSYLEMKTDADVPGVLERALAMAREGRPVVVEVAIDYSSKTYFTRGVVATNFWRLPWPERLRFAGRAIARRITG